MADLNALIAQGAQFRIPPPVDPMGNMPQLMQMRAAQNQNALAQYQLGAAQREDAATNALNLAYQNAYDPATGKIDINRLRQSLASSGAGAKIPGVEKSLMEAEKARLEQQKLQGDVNLQPVTKSTAENKLLDEKLKQSRSFLDTLNPAAPDAGDRYLAWHEANHADPIIGPALAARGVTADQSRAVIQQAIRQGPQALADQINQSKLGAEKFIELNKSTLTSQNIGDQLRIMATPGLGGATTEVPGSRIATTMTPGEKARLKQSADQFNRRLEQETAAGELTPETRDFAANLVAQGGAMPSLGMGKAAAKMRSEILSRAAQIATESSGSAAGGAADVLANKVGLTGRAAEERVLGAQGANVALASSEARKMIELAKGYSAAIDRTQYPSINAIQNAVNKGTGDKNIVALNTALNSLVNSYARAINPKGIATVSDKNHAREIVNANYANGQLDAIFSVMDEEMKAAQESTGVARASLRGKPAAAAPAAVAASAGVKFLGFEPGKP